MTSSDFRRVRVQSLIESGILAINDGYRVKNSELGPVGIPFVRGGDIGDGWIETNVVDHIRPEFASRVTPKLTQPGDVAFITKGTVGRVGRIHEGQPAVVLAPQVAYWRSLDESKLNSRFLFYLLRSGEFQGNLDAVKTHGSMVADYVSLTDQRIFQLTLPRIHQQERIADILGTLDDKIELNRRMNETLEAMARRLFKSWFVDFDPIHAKTTLRHQHPKLSNADLSRRALPNMAPEIAELFPDGFEDSTLGPIPRGWKVDEIGNVVTVLGGGTPSTKSPAFWVGGTHPFCTPKDMAGLESPVLLHTERHLTDAGVAKVSSGRLPVGTVLLSSRAPIGYLAITHVPVTVNQGIIAMICNGELPNQYVLHWARTNDEAIVANANGSTFLEISKRNFRPLPVVIPHEGIADAFQSQAADFHQAVARNLRESRELSLCRDKLFPRLLSGELEIEHIPAGAST